MKTSNLKYFVVLFLLLGAIIFTIITRPPVKKYVMPKELEPVAQFSYYDESPITPEEEKLIADMHQSALESAKKDHLVCDFDKKISLVSPSGSAYYDHRYRQCRKDDDLCKNSSYFYDELNTNLNPSISFFTKEYREAKYEAIQEFAIDESSVLGIKRIYPGMIVEKYSPIAPGVFYLVSLIADMGGCGIHEYIVAHLDPETGYSIAVAEFSSNEYYYEDQINHECTVSKTQALATFDQMFKLENMAQNSKLQKAIKLVGSIDVCK